MDKIDHNYTFGLRKSCRMAAYNQLRALARAGARLSTGDRVHEGNLNRGFGLCQSGNLWQRMFFYHTSWHTCYCKSRRPTRYKERRVLCKHMAGKWLERLAANYERQRGNRVYADTRVIVDPSLAHKLDQDYQD